MHCVFLHICVQLSSCQAVKNVDRLQNVEAMMFVVTGALILPVAYFEIVLGYCLDPGEECRDWPGGTGEVLKILQLPADGSQAKRAILAAGSCCSMAVAPSQMVSQYTYAVLQ